MKTQSAKRRRIVYDGSEITTDRLSQLPQPILHHILSLLPQDEAVRTCLLSHSWRYLWHGRYNVELHENSFARRKNGKKNSFFRRKNDFFPVLDKILQRYHDQDLSLQRFLVKNLQLKIDSESIALLEKWVPRVIQKMGVTSLNLEFSPANRSFSVPLVVFQAESLVELRLRGCLLNQINSTDNVLCKNLQTLCLRNVYIEEKIFEKIMSSCPLIENVIVDWCDGLKTIKLKNNAHNHNLKNFDCSVYVGYDQRIEIEGPCSLETICIKNCNNWFLHHSSIFFPHLKSLTLHGVKLSAESFDSLSANFPCLNELVLDSCYGFKEFVLLSCSIKHLTIKGSEKKIKALIDTPNILYFEYSGCDILPSINFAPTSNEWKSHISVFYKPKPSDKDASSWFLKLNKLLKALSHSHITLDLNCNSKDYKNLQIKDSYGRFYKPVVVEQLRLMGFFSSSSGPDILNCLFRILRPRYIHMDLYAKARAEWKKENNRLAEFISKLIPKEMGEMRQCCFWLQDLEEVTIDVRDMKAKESHRVVKGTSFPTFRKKQPDQQICFRLKWRDQLSKLT